MVTGTVSVVLGGKVSAAGPVYPTNGSPVFVAINGITNSTSVNDSTGDFSITYPTASLTTNGSPYAITYIYGGSANLMPAVNSSTTLTVVEQVVPTISSWPTATGITYGDALSVSSLSDGSASVSGTFTFTASSTIPPVAGTYLASGTFTPDNTAIYSTVISPNVISVAVGTRGLTIGTPAVTSRQYNGLVNNATITGTLVGVVAGDTATEVSLVGTGTFASSGVANGIAVTSTSTLTGTKASSYTLTQPTDLSGNITKATLTVRADNKNRLPGTANPSLTYTVSGYQNGENDVAVGLTGVPGLSTDAVLGSPEGPYTITIVPNTLVITSGNYALDFVSGTLKVVGVITWTKGIGAWDIETSVNWTNAVFGAVTYVDGGEVLFNDLPAGFGPFTVTLNTTVHPSSVSFNNVVKDYVISGSGSISGTTTLTKSGGGSVTLGMVNTYSGGTVVNGGGLWLANGNSKLGLGPVTMAGGSSFKVAGDPLATITNTFNLTGGSVNIQYPFGGATDLALTGPIGGAGGLELTSDPSGRGLTLSGSNTFSGGIIFRGDGNSRVSIQNASALGIGVFRSEKMAAGVGTLDVGANLSAGLGVANTFDIPLGRYLNLNVLNPLLISGSITNGGNLYKTGSALLTLSGANSYTGTTTVVSGELTLVNKYALGQTALIVEANTKVNLNYSGVMYIRALTINGAVQPIGEYGAFNFSQYFTGGGRLSTDKPIIGTLIIIQ
jgi:autotransporter-associated beta strand protein